MARGDDVVLKAHGKNRVFPGICGLNPGVKSVGLLFLKNVTDFAAGTYRKEASSHFFEPVSAARFRLRGFAAPFRLRGFAAPSS